MALVFTGTYEHTIDAKNRLAVPVDIRERLAAERTWLAPPSLEPASAATAAEVASVSRPLPPLGLYVTLGQGCLSLYTDKGFEKRADELDQSQLATDELLEYERYMFSLAARVEIDQAGRIRLPDNLFKMSGLGTDIVLLGVKDHLEIRDRAAWKAQVEEMLRNRPQMLRNPRELMRAAQEKKQ